MAPIVAAAGFVSGPVCGREFLFRYRAELVPIK